MTKLVTNKFKTHMAAQFIESVSESSNSLYYVFTGETLPFADDNVPPVPTNSTFGVHNDVYDNLLFGKKIASDDVKHMIRRVNWQSGNTYPAYSYASTTLETDNFYAISEESGNYAVFKCLDNNGGVAANDQPLFSETAADDEFYQTNDKYVWKLMYNISASDWSKFATNDFAPVIPNANVSANAVSGSIEAIIINSGGARYNAHANGTFKEISVAGNTLIHGLQSSSVTLSANTDFYKNSTLYVRSGTGAGQARNISEYIVTGSERRVLINPAFTTLPDTTSVFEIAPGLTIKGDGDDAVAIATIDTTANSISTVEIVNRGSGYSFADVIISSNGDSTVAANLTPSLSPPGGHGSDAINELYASRAGISVTYANNESNTIPTTNDYRSVGIIKDPLFANVELTLTTSTASSFLDGETVIHYVPQSSNTLLRSYSYTLSRYQTLTVNTSTMTGFTTGNKISSDAKGAEIIASSANTIHIRLNEGSAAFAVSDMIGNNTITETVSSISAAQPPVVVTASAHGLANAAAVSFHDLNGTALDDDDAATVYYVKPSNTTAFSVFTDTGLATPFDNSGNTTASSGFVTNGLEVKDIHLASFTHTGNNDPISGKDDAGNAFGFSSNLPLTSIAKRNTLAVAHTKTTTAATLTDITLVPASDVIEIEIYTSAETVTLPDYIGRTTAEVSNRAGDVLRLRNIRGDFATGHKIKGLTSGIEAEIEAIDRSFTTFNQLTEMAVQIVDAGTGDPGVANTGFTIDQFVTQDQGTAGPVQTGTTTYAHGTVFAVSNTITRFVDSVTAANPAVVKTTVAHGYSNGMVAAFSSLNGSIFANTVPIYYIGTINTTAFSVYSDAALSTAFDNSANSAANTGTIIASGIGTVGASAYRTFFLSNVKGIFGVSDDAAGVVNTFVSNTASGGTGASAKITSRIDGDLVDNSGEVIYIENMSPVARSDDQSEKVRIILEF
tara:strand:- start:30 stop:2906 length:2877 start_codon:yes stop_codon:yes gene_type:complete